MNELTNLYAKPKEWQNYGDCNPERHGGLFTTWNNDMWKIIETTHYADIHDSVSKNQHRFTIMFMEPMDIWKNGNPLEGFTMETWNKLQNFSGLPFDPIKKENSDSEIPDNETYAGYVEWYLNNHFLNLLPYLVSIHTSRHIRRNDNFNSDYWGYLQNHGIEKENF